MGIKVIVTGATGMVGEGVLHCCLQSKAVDHVLVLSRKSCGLSHPKLTEILLDDFSNIHALAPQLRGYDACFFCLGVSSVGMSEERYTALTYDLTMQCARVMYSENPSMVFCYVSGAGTDSSEKGSRMWARVKGKTENDLQRLGFKRVYCFRPAYIHPMPGMTRTLKAVRYISWMYPVLRLILPNAVCTLEQLGNAMINCATRQADTTILESKDIVEAAGH